MKRLGLGRWLALCLVLLVLAGFALQLLAGAERGAGTQSVDSLAPDGRRFLWLVLEELGFEREAWKRPPEELGAVLPSGRGLLVSARVPDPHALGGRKSVDAQGGPASAEGASKPEALLALERRRAEAYRAFVERGGTWILPAGEACERFLEQGLGLAQHARAARLAKRREPSGDGLPGSVRRLRGPDGALLELRPAPERALAEPGAARGARPLLVGEAGGTYAVALPLGAGEIVLLADDGFLANGDAFRAERPSRGLGAADAALLLVRLIEAVRQEGPILLDEFVLGRWRPESAWSFAFAPSLRTFSLQLLLLACAGALAWTWPRAFPRDPRALETSAPLERARARAGLFARAGRFELAGEELRRGICEQLARRLGRRRPPPASAEEGAAAPLELEPVLAALAGLEPALGERARALLAGEPVRDAAGLEELGRKLAALEAELAALERERFAHERAPGRPPSVSLSAREEERGGA